LGRDEGGSPGVGVCVRGKKRSAFRHYGGVVRWWLRYANNDLGRGTDMLFIQRCCGSTGSRLHVMMTMSMTMSIHCRHSKQGFATQIPPKSTRDYIRHLPRNLPRNSSQSTPHSPLHTVLHLPQLLHPLHIPIPTLLHHSSRLLHTLTAQSHKHIPLLLITNRSLSRRSLPSFP
jgi:hypothetical protein